MIAYQRFIPRATDRDVMQAAKAANPAKAEAECRPAWANALLSSANLGDLSSGLAGLSRSVATGSQPFSRFGSFSGGSLETRPQFDEARAAIPRAWVDGLERLARMDRPRRYPPAAWECLILDAEQFMDRWAAQAAALGWQHWEVWGVHGRAPWDRLEGRGLVATLQGSKIGALTTAEALIVKPNGARLTFRRRARDPLHPSERALLWELDPES